jgi:hypothetical protein
VKVPCPSREKGHTWGVKEGYLPARFEGGLYYSAAWVFGCLGSVAGRPRLGWLNWLAELAG